ncbi:hypothetical protein EW146_g8635 [Bondarzewia mesenterica]|uniref:Uncharacterized protein n=1 Tax=Bondarzewia mesenterica TaxID=1095465 RepID=A0A4S4LID5_9AGAM|nr:hypothetical protein EW146_g8635 [Bondarzewia mesenterica]
MGAVELRILSFRVWRLSAECQAATQRRIERPTPLGYRRGSGTSGMLPQQGLLAPMSYYPEHVFFQSTDSTTNESAVPPHADTSTDPVLRHCSVKGCSKALPVGYTLKMCDACRGRHRIYANTKRAKRKMEKAAVGGVQHIGHAVSPLAPPASASGVSSAAIEPSSSRSQTQQESYETHVWTPEIDPRLFSSTSELAGALTLPLLDNPPVSSSTGALTDIRGPPAESATTSGSSNPSTQGIPPRYCSIKGCKAIIGGDYFYKMCIPCRNRYRGYGTTKRSKWKREREAALEELAHAREAEDKRRAEAGLAPLDQLPDSERLAWEGGVVHGFPALEATDYASPSASPSQPPVRMCTVSHCHAILPGHYEFRRCVQHRLQNRHHSKLKRVRDKESKSVFLVEEQSLWEGDEGDAKNRSAVGETTVEPLYMDHPLGREFREGSEAMKESTTQPPPSGIPPPARGTRRTNHVCTIKWCHNLLDPNSPWKMCEVHREKDRVGRRRKAEKDKEEAKLKEAEEGGQGMVFVMENQGNEGVVEAQIQASASSEGQAETMTIDDSPAAGPEKPPAMPASTSKTPSASQRADVVFMHPLLPPEDDLPHDVQAVVPAKIIGAAVSSVTFSLHPATVPTSSTHTVVPIANPEVTGGPTATQTETVAADLNELTFDGQTADGDPEPPQKKQRGPYKRRTKAVKNVKTYDNTATSMIGAQATQSTGADMISAQAPAPAVPSNTTSAPARASESTHTLSMPEHPAPPAHQPDRVSQPHSLAHTPYEACAASAQFQVPYYMPPPYNVPYGMGQPPYYTPGTFPPVALSPYTSYSPFAPPPPPYASYQPSMFAPGAPPRQYIYSPHAPQWQAYGVGGSMMDLGAYDPSGQHTPQTKTPARSQAPKRKRNGQAATASPAPEQELQIVMVKQPRATNGSSNGSTSVAIANTQAEEPPMASLSAPEAEANVVQGASDVPSTNVIVPLTEGGSSEMQVDEPTQPHVKQRACASENCHRKMSGSGGGTLCDRCKTRIRKKQERTKHRLRLEPRKVVAAKAATT